MNTIQVRLEVQVNDYTMIRFVQTLCDAIIYDFHSSETQVEYKWGIYDFYGTPENIYKIIKKIQKTTNAEDVFDSLSLIDYYCPKYICFKIVEMNNELVNKLRKQMLMDKKQIWNN